MEIVMLSGLLILGAGSLYLVWRKNQEEYYDEPYIQSPQSNQSKSMSSFTSVFDNASPYLSKNDNIGSTAIFSKLTLNINTVSIACVLAVFVFVILTFAIPDMAIATMLIGSALFFPIGMILGAMTSGAMRIKMMRKLTGRNYGVIKFIHSNRLIKPVIANLDQDIIQFSGGVYFLDKQAIKREGKDELSNGIIHESKIKFEEGIPTVFYDITDIMPVNFESAIPRDETTDDDKFRLPTQVSATLNKEIAVEKAKIMKSFKSQQSLMLVIILALVAINVFFGYSMYSSWEPMRAAVETLTSRISG